MKQALGTAQRYRWREERSSACRAQGMPVGMGNLNPSPGEVVGMATNFLEADLDSLSQLGMETTKCEEGLQLVVNPQLPTVPGPSMGGESLRRRDSRWESSPRRRELRGSDSLIPERKGLKRPRKGGTRKRQCLLDNTSILLIPNNMQDWSPESCLPPNLSCCPVARAPIKLPANLSIRRQTRVS